MTRLLVVSDKHDTSIFDVNTDVDLDAACRMILRERLETGYYFEESDIGEYYERHKADLKNLSELNINALPTDELRVTARADRERTQSLVDTYAEELAFTAEVKRCLDSPAGTADPDDVAWLEERRAMTLLIEDPAIRAEKMARLRGEPKLWSWSLLDRRSDHEYEAVSLEWSRAIEASDRADA